MSISKKEKKTEVRPNNFGRHPLFSIYEIDEKGNASEIPLVSFGMGKAELIEKHMEEFKKFLAENKK